MSTKPNRNNAITKQSDKPYDEMMEQFRRMTERMQEMSSRIEDNHSNPFDNHLEFFAAEEAPRIVAYPMRTHWDKHIRPILHNHNVQSALNKAMVQLVLRRGKHEGDIAKYHWEEGSPPYLWSVIKWWTKKPKKYSIDWYRVVGGCWFMAPFCIAIGRELFPELKWKVWKSNRHAVAIGIREDSRVLIMDILDRGGIVQSAEQTYDFADQSISDEDFGNKWGVDLQKQDAAMKAMRIW